VVTHPLYVFSLAQFSVSVSRQMAVSHPWSRLLADYNLLQGRLWVLILVVTGISPFAAAKLRGLV